MKTKMDMTQFGERLKSLRTQKGLTQAKLAELAGLSRRMIVHYESKAVMPPLSKVKKLADVLDISVDSLLGRESSVNGRIKEDSVSYKIIKRVKIIEKLPVRDRKAIFRLINSLAEKNNVKNDE